MERIATVKKTSEILHDFSFLMKKNYGQNFLVVPKVPEYIANNIGIDKETLVIEIGPGVGALTEFLLENAKKVICYEIDKELIPILKEVFKDKDNLEVVHKDFLKVDLNKDIDFSEYKKVVVASNLPYYITSEILIRLFKEEYPFVIAAMMQKEVAHRILKSKGGKDENELTLCAKYFTEFSLLKEVSKNDFFPKPKVDSTVLLFKKKEGVTLREEYIKLIRALYTQRRKTIWNNLKDEVESKEELERTLEELMIERTTRVEELEFKDILRLLEVVKLK